jgi:hypothetical protein
MSKRFWARKWGEFPRAEYMAWDALIRRCCDPRHASFARYGGRGIHVCERWRHDFMAFLADMGPRPSPAHSIDRRDNDGGYEPGNCRWATRSQQQRNIGRVHRAVGASYVPRDDRWKAQISINGREVYLGHFKTEAEARVTYRIACLHARVMADLAAAALLPPLPSPGGRAGASGPLRPGAAAPGGPGPRGRAGREPRS